MRWLERSRADDAAAIDWLRSRCTGRRRSLEPVGPDFDPEGRGRVSTYTGLPTVIGWPGHEVQWGHDPRLAGADVQRLYGTRDAARRAAAARRYDVRYVFVGSLERGDYPAEALAKFARLGNEAYRSGETIIYELKV